MKLPAYAFIFLSVMVFCAVGAQSGAAAERSIGKVDIDLTKFSATMVYSEIFNMMVEPEYYVGKTVKMRGLFDFYRDKAAGRCYFACVVQDAAACCAQGLEFVLVGGNDCREDLPEAGDEITVVGVFDSCVRGGEKYYLLKDAEFM